MNIELFYKDLFGLTNYHLEATLDRMELNRKGNKTEKVERIMKMVDKLGRCVLHYFDYTALGALNTNSINIDFDSFIDLRIELINYYFGKAIDQQSPIQFQLKNEANKKNRSPFTKKEFLELVEVDEDTLSSWFALDLIGFDINKTDKFETFHIKETRFIKKLKDNIISHDYLMKMLKKLTKPYIYSLKEIYWDFDDESWKSKIDLKENMADTQFFMPEFLQASEHIAKYGDIDILFDLNEKIVEIINKYTEEYDENDD
jgi:hypothetical protein